MRVHYLMRELHAMSNLIDCIVEHEGRARYAYQDTLGYWTIGVGRSIDSRCLRGLSFEEQNYLLNNDLQLCRSQLQNKAYYQGQSQVRQECLIELCFNMGIKRLETFSKMLKAFIAKDYKEAAKELADSKWASQAGSSRLNNISQRILTDAYSA